MKMRISKITVWILMIGLLLAGSIFTLVWNQQRKLWSNRFLSHVDRDMSILQGRIEVNEEILLGIRALFDASNYVDLNEFRTYVAPIMKRYEFIQALEWVPRVLAVQRKAYEKRMRNAGFSNFEFKDLSHQGKMGRAGFRAKYFPVYYVHPIKGNEKAIGFDLASNPIRLKFLEKSLRSFKV